MSKREDLYEHKRQAMQLLKAGLSWQDANEQSGLNYSRTGIQGLYRKWCARGDEALIDHRHGHVYKATVAVQEWLKERCAQDGEVRGPRLASELRTEFGVELDPHYVNVLRHQLGLPVPQPGRPSQSQPSEQGTEGESEADFSPGRA
jgi:transposase